jgi:hypothetical protein
MPNWCDNQIDVEGPKEALIEFAKILGEMNEAQDAIYGELSFEKFLPLSEFDSASIQSEYWGTKWDVDDSGFEYHLESEEIFLYFQSAWGPPTEFTKYVSCRFPELIFTIRFYEPGMSFAGEMVFLSGEILVDKDYLERDKKEVEEKISFIEEYFEDDIRERLAEEEREEEEEND